MTFTYPPHLFHGILLVDKPVETMSFRAVSHLRHITKERTIGHAGTLDPFASGLLILLIGKKFTRLSDQFLNCSKEYIATLRLGSSTDSYDRDGVETATNPYIPSLEEVEGSIEKFQGKTLQMPPMFSAKKVNGKKLYELARQGKEIERELVLVEMKIELISYAYPELILRVKSSKGTYIRSLAHDLGKELTSLGHLNQLRRTHSSGFSVENAIGLNQITLENPELLLANLITDPPLAKEPLEPCNSSLITS